MVERLRMGHAFFSVIFLHSAAAFLAVLVLVPVMRKAALIFGFVDQPGGRKQHHKPIPPIGGLVIFPVFMAVAGLSGIDFTHIWSLYAGLAVLIVLGSLDDYIHVQPWPKFVVQLCVASAVVLSGQARLYQLGDLFGFGDVGLDFMSVPFSIAAVMLLINAMNLIDGLDGLAAGYGFIVLFWLLLASWAAGAAGHIALMAPMMAALCGFLVFNMRNPLRRKASVFLGDAGSMGLGLVLAWFCISLAQQKGQVLAPISVAWILAIPIIDTCAQFYRRVCEGRHPFAPDRGHFHHHLIHAGISVHETTAFILSLAFMAGAVGYLGIEGGVPAFVLTAAWILLLLVHIRLSEKPEIYITFFKRLQSGQGSACG